MAVGGSQFWHDNTLITGNLWKLDDQAEPDTPATTSTDHGTGGVVVRQVVPYTTGGGGATAVPAVDAAPTGRGWRVADADMGGSATFVRTIAAGTWQMIVSATSSDVLAAASTVTAILYQVTGAGATAATEIGRGSVSAPRDGTDATINIQRSGGNVAAQTYDAANESFQVEVYISGPGTAVVGNVITFRTTGNSRLISPAVIKTVSTETGGAASPRNGGSASGALLQSYKNTVLGDSPAFFWDISESSGTIAEDATANNRDGELQGGVGRATTGGPTSALPKRYLFDGTDDRIVATVSPGNGYSPFNVPAESRSWTFEAWVRRTDADSFDTIWGTEGGLELNTIRLVNGSPSGALQLTANDLSSAEWTYAEHGMGTNTWYHVVITITGTSVAELFVDGSSKGTKSGFGGFQSTAAPLKLGIYQTTNDPWIGDIAYPAFYTTVLSAARIQAHYLARDRATDEAAGVGKQVIVDKLGGGLRPAIGGGSDKVQKINTGGALSPRAGGGARIVQKAATGGGLRPAVAGGSKVATTARVGGSSSPRTGGGVGKREIIKLGGARTDSAWGGGARQVIFSDTGGAISVRSGGGPKLVSPARLGGGLLPTVGGGSKLVTASKEGGGLSPGVAGGVGKREVIKLGGAFTQRIGGASKQISTNFAGGAIAAGSGGSIQYSVYTFAIKDFTRDGRTDSIVVGAKVACFRQDNYNLIANNPIQTSDLVTGAFAFRVSNPAVDPTTYWVSMIKETGERIFGRTDEDLVPEVELVQGHE